MARYLLVTIIGGNIDAAFAGGAAGVLVIMDKAYEGDETRQLVFDLSMTPVVPPKTNRVMAWAYDREM